MIEKGVLVISLDFELQWGSFDKRVLNQSRKNELDNSRKIIPLLLNLFEKYEIHATWASVGMLLNKDNVEWIRNKPTLLPKYSNHLLSSYSYFENIINDRSLDDYFFAPDIIKQIYDRPFQEIASHTYSHYYCLEANQTKNEFEEDLKKSLEIFCLSNINLTSLVFPRNQFNVEYLTLLDQYGIQTIRTNPSIWFWNLDNNLLINRIGRLFDTFIPMSNNNILKHQDIKNNILVELPSSRFFKAYKPSLKILNKLKLMRIKNEMTIAAKTNRYYHLWWHPENFGVFPDECLHELELILIHFAKLKKQFDFKSMSMNEYASKLKNKSV